MMLEECGLINELPLLSAKFHQLQIVKGTRMEKEFAERPGDFERFALDEYIDFFIDMLERLRPGLFIERFAGEVPPRFVNETPWGLIRNAGLLKLLDTRLAQRDTFPGTSGALTCNLIAKTAFYHTYFQSFWLHLPNFISRCRLL